MKNCISKRNLARFVATPYSTLIRNSSYQCNHGTATSYRIERSGKKTVSNPRIRRLPDPKLQSL